MKRERFNEEQIIKALKSYKNMVDALEKIYENRLPSILMVSHDLHLLMASTKQVVCLFHHVCCSGEPQAVTKDPEFISLFGDDTANMVAVYRHSHSHIHENGNRV